MLSKINTAVIHGAEAVSVRLETDTRKGMPTFQLVGNPESTLREAKERIRAAIGNSGNVIYVRTCGNGLKALNGRRVKIRTAS